MNQEQTPKDHISSRSHLGKLQNNKSIVTPNDNSIKSDIKSLSNADLPQTLVDRDVIKNVVIKLIHHCHSYTHCDSHLKVSQV